MTQPELYYELQAAVTRNNFGTSQGCISAQASTSVPRCMIPALYFSQIGKSARVKMAGTVATTSAATVILAAGLDAAAATIAGTGGATLFTLAALTPTAAVTCPWDLDMDITCQAIGNAGTTIQANGLVRVNNVASSGAWGTGMQAAAFANNLTGVNNEINLWLELFGTWSVGATGNTTTLQQFKVYLEN
jgi:hypothetical protein